MDEHLKKMLLSVVSFILCSVVSAILMEHMGDTLLMNSEERHSTEQARHVLTELQRHWGRQIDGELNVHELQTASGMSTSHDVSFGDIGGLQRVKRELHLHVIVPLVRHQIFFGLPALRPPSGVLLEGPPGTGKTMLARALAYEAKVPLVPLMLSTIENKYVGESQKLLRAVFSLATKLAPSIIFVDEIDGMMRQRSHMDSAHDYGLKTTFLQLVDQIQGKPIIVIAATNCSNMLDPALRRRLPRTYRIDLPDISGRIEILKSITMHEPRAAPAWVANETTGYSGSALTELYRRASAFRNEAVATNTQLLDQVYSADELHIALPAITDEQWDAALTAT